MCDRKSLLKTMLQYDHPGMLPELREALRAYNWDSDEEFVTLTKKDIHLVLDRYLRSELTSKEVEDWADAFDMRDDVGFEDEDTIDIIGELANPVVPLTPEYARKLIE